MVNKLINKLLNKPAPLSMPAKDEFSILKEQYPDFTDFAIKTFLNLRPFTMTSLERIECVIRTIDYIHQNKLDGDIVECGVWKGGTAMAIIEALKTHGSLSKTIYLYDTFEQGMTEAGPMDVSFQNDNGKEVVKKWEETNKYPTITEVKTNIQKHGYPEDKMKFVVGDVMKTIPAITPEKISLLRLDTDWYDTTKHELIHLFPRVVSGGVIIIDDYGHWQGAKKAVDEYLKDNGIVAFLNRIDYTGRIFIKN